MSYHCYTPSNLLGSLIGPTGLPGQQGATGPAGLPGQQGATGPTGGPQTRIGFSAFKSDPMLINGNSPVGVTGWISTSGVSGITGAVFSDSAFDNTNGIYTAPIAGVYNVQALITLQIDRGSVPLVYPLYVKLYLHGSITYYSYASTNYISSGSGISEIVSLVANTNIYLRSGEQISLQILVYSNPGPGSTVTVISNIDTTFSAMYISP